MAKKPRPSKPDDGLVEPGQPNILEVETRSDEKIGRTLAKVTLDPQTRNSALAITFGSQMFGDRSRPDPVESSAALGEEIAKAKKGDLSLASALLTSHAVSLDTLFTELARRSGMNMGQHPDAAERYMRLALKAQSACRSTLEALTKLHQPREQTVKHVHINKGGQAVVADHVHNHTGGRENGKTGEQSDATGATGTSAALPCPDPLRDGVPITGFKGQPAVQNARWDQPRGPKGQ